jgi:hypothetical protein
VAGLPGLILPLTIVTVAGFGLFILMLGVALGTSDRAMTLARLTVMGHERPTRLVLLEALPAVVVGGGGGRRLRAGAAAAKARRLSRHGVAQTLRAE